MSKIKTAFFLLTLFLFSLVFGGCAGTAATAEEYYSIGMAYFELGKYEEAEKWLLRARQSDRTMVASTYNLGRLAYEMQKYNEAARHFESILKIDPDNILALKAAAYSRIMTGDLNIAEKHYSKLLSLVPESADDGYNHGLVLFAMGRYSACEEVLEKYPIALLENKDVMLLYARAQAALNKVQAIESYASFLGSYSDPKARYEYAQILENNQLYARAIEEYKKALGELQSASTDPRRSDVRFALSRVLLIADGGSSDGITELQGAVADGFKDIASIERLLNRVTPANRDIIRNIINNMRN